MNSVSNNFKFLERAGEFLVDRLGLVTDVSSDPIWFNCVFTLMVDELTA